MPWPANADPVEIMPIDQIPVIEEHLRPVFQFFGNEHADQIILQLARGFICLTRLRDRGLIAVATRGLCYTLEDHETFPLPITFEEVPDPYADSIEWNGEIPGVCGPIS